MQSSLLCSNIKPDFSCPESIMTVKAAGKKLHRLRGHEMTHNAHKKPCLETVTNKRLSKQLRNLVFRDIVFQKRIIVRSTSVSFRAPGFQCKSHAAIINKWTIHLVRTQKFLKNYYL